MIRARITESRDIHDLEFILQHRPRASARQLPSVVRSDFMTPQSELLREACAIRS